MAPVLLVVPGGLDAVGEPAGRQPKPKPNRERRIGFNRGGDHPGGPPAPA